MNKPTIQYQRGLWYCSVRSLNMSVLGSGDTPEDSYVDWKRQCDSGKYKYMSAWAILSKFRKPIC